MNINIQEYEAKLQQYNQQLATEKQEVASAERAIIVAQTQLENYQQQMEALEQECQNLIGQSIDNIEKVIQENMNNLNVLMSNFQSAKSVSNNLNTMTEDELKDSMQFMTEEF